VVIAGEPEAAVVAVLAVQSAIAAGFLGEDRFRRVGPVQFEQVADAVPHIFCRSAGILQLHPQLVRIMCHCVADIGWENDQAGLVFEIISSGRAVAAWFQFQDFVSVIIKRVCRSVGTGEFDLKLIGSVERAGGPDTVFDRQDTIAGHADFQGISTSKFRQAMPGLLLLPLVSHRFVFFACKQPSGVIARIVANSSAKGIPRNSVGGSQ